MCEQNNRLNFNDINYNIILKTVTHEYTIMGQMKRNCELKLKEGFLKLYFSIFTHLIRFLFNRKKILGEIKEVECEF